MRYTLSTTFNNLAAHLAVIGTIGQVIGSVFALDANPLFWPLMVSGYASLALSLLVIDLRQEIRRLASDGRHAARLGEV